MPALSQQGIKMMDVFENMTSCTVTSMNDGWIMIKMRIRSLISFTIQIHNLLVVTYTDFIIDLFVQS